MSKIVQAVNAMIFNQSKITQVTKSLESNELYFIYNHKYVWSIVKSEDEYSLFYYPNYSDISKLLLIEDYNWDTIDLVRYSTKEIGTKEARSTFAELYNIVNENLFGINNILDEIIEDMPF